MTAGSAPHAPAGLRAAGFTLISALVAIVVACVGVLVTVRLLASYTAAATQNDVVTRIAALGDGFWGTVQANPAVLADGAFAGSFNSASVSSAPAALQPWLTQALATLPAGTVSIATSGDAASGNPCSPSTGCTVTLTLSWTQVASAGINASDVTRSQTLYYQFGL